MDSVLSSGMAPRDCEDSARTEPRHAAASIDGAEPQPGTHRNFRPDNAEPPTETIPGTTADSTVPLHLETPVGGTIAGEDRGEEEDERMAQQRLSLELLDRLTAAHASADQGEWAKVLSAVSCDESSGGSLAAEALGMSGGPLGTVGGAGMYTGADGVRQAQFDTMSVIAQIRTALLGKMGRYEEVISETTRALSGAHGGAAPSMSGALLLHFNRAVANKHLSRWSHVVLDCDVVLSYLCPKQMPSFVCNAMGGGGSASVVPTVRESGSLDLFSGEGSSRFKSPVNEAKARQLEYKTRVMRASAYARIGRFASVIDDCNVVLDTLVPNCHLALQNRGFAYLYSGRPSAALRDLERCPVNDAVARGKSAARAKLSCGPLSMSIGALPTSLDAVAMTSRSSLSSDSSSSSTSSSELGGITRVPSSMHVLQTPMIGPKSPGPAKKRIRQGLGQVQGYEQGFEQGHDHAQGREQRAEANVDVDLRHFDGNGPVSPVPMDSSDDIGREQTVATVEASDEVMQVVVDDAHVNKGACKPARHQRARSLSMVSDTGRGPVVGRGMSGGARSPAVARTAGTAARIMQEAAAVAVKLTSMHRPSVAHSAPRPGPCEGGMGGMRHSKSVGSLKYPHLVACARPGAERTRTGSTKVSHGAGGPYHVRHKSM